MGYFYFDESVHSQARFALGAFAYSEIALDRSVADALLLSGLKPGIDEFKSGSRMDRQPAQIAARTLLKSVIQEHCRIGLVVTPDGPTLGNEALLGLDKILTTNQFRSASHDVFFDEGLCVSEASGEIAANEIVNDKNCRFHFEQDSVSVMGIQVADLIAHTCATMLLGQFGLAKKMVKSGYDADSGYEPEMRLDFELWAGLRYNFFAAAPPPIDDWKSQSDFQVDVESRGLHIAHSCEPYLRDAAVARFGRMYLGCIH